MFVSADNPTIDKLLILAGGDVKRVSDALRACGKYERRGWLMKRNVLVADLGAVVKWLVARRDNITRTGTPT